MEKKIVDKLMNDMVDQGPSAADGKTLETERPYDETYRRGPVMMRGPMIPKDNTYANLLAPEGATDWLHTDPWRVLRIQAEFVDGFGALAELGPAVSIFGSAHRSHVQGSSAGR